MKKLLSLLLAGLMCTSVLVGCKNEDDTPKTTTGSADVGEVDEEMKKIDEYIASLSSQYDFDGTTFSYLGATVENAEFEEETGNIENDALYHRQREIEENFNVTWNSVKPDTANSENGSVTKTYEYVQQSVLAGSHDYDLCYGSLIGTMRPLFNENCLESVSDFSVLDLDADWWPSTLRDTHSIGGELSILAGPIVTRYYTDACCLLINMQVADDYNIEIPYDSVRDGTWTFDKMFEIASAVPINATGAGAYRYGDPNGLAILFANGLKLTNFDENDVPYVDEAPSAALVDLCDRFAVVMGDGTQTAQVIYARGEDCSEKYGCESLEDMFVDGGFLFYFSDTGKAVDFREREVEYGIVPLPKSSASQSQYYSYADTWACLFCAVPRCAADLEMTDVILEAMAALGLKHIKPAYYDKLLKGRSTHDADSRDMLDIIFETKIYDIVDIYTNGDINQYGLFVRQIANAIKYDSSMITSGYAAGAKLAAREIRNIMKMIENNKK